jgi:hypothetical protein
MEDSTDSSSTFQTLASVLAGGLSGYVDAQHGFYAQQPLPQTGYGYAGTAQPTPSGSFLGGSVSPIVLLVVVGAFAFLLLKK